MTDNGLLKFYEQAKTLCIEKGYSEEIEIVENRFFGDYQPKDFFHEYVYVVLNAGMLNQIAEKIFQRFIESGYDLNTIGHEGKRRAISKALQSHLVWFSLLQDSKDKITYLESLPWIGPITKYHLARNIGLDVAKPDRHMVRVAQRFGFSDVQEMCEAVSKETGDRIGTVDVVIWRACNLGLLSSLSNSKERGRT